MTEKLSFRFGAFLGNFRLAQETPKTKRRQRAKCPRAGSAGSDEGEDGGGRAAAERRVSSIKCFLSLLPGDVVMDLGGRG